MFCGKCGTNNPDTNKFCKKCGKPIGKRQPSAVPAPATSVMVATYPPAPPNYYISPPPVPPVPVATYPTAPPNYYVPPPPIPPVPVATYPQAPPGYYAPPQPVQVSAGTPAIAKPPSNKGLFLLDIMSILAGAVSWFLFPYICGILAIVFGGIVLFKSKNKKSIGAILVAILGILGIVIGLASIIVDLFYFSLFPPVGL